MWRNDGETVFMSENFKMTTLALSSRDEKTLGSPLILIAEDEADIADILSGCEEVGCDVRLRRMADER